MQTIIAGNTEKIQLQKELDEISAGDDTKNALEKAERVIAIQNRIMELETKEEEAKSSNVLAGFGFKEEDLHKLGSEFSGGWQMKIALAKAFLVGQADIVLLDEPTNHLDLDAVLWLQEYIASLDYTVIVVSHDRTFLNSVAEEIIYFTDNKLEYYKGDYDQFEKTRSEMLKNQKKQLDNQSRQVDHLQKFIDRFRYVIHPPSIFVLILGIPYLQIL